MDDAVTSMNWRLGLHRISAVFWGWWGLVALFVGSVILYQNGSGSETAEMVGMCIAAVAGCYIGHRLTCWVVDGFTSK